MLEDWYSDRLLDRSPLSMIIMRYIVMNSITKAILTVAYKPSLPSKYFLHSYTALKGITNTG